MNMRYCLLGTISVAFSIATPVIGFAQDFCETLAARVTPDISSQNTSDERFSLFKEIVSQEKFRSFDSSSQQTLDAGLTVVSYVDAFLGTTSNKDTWETNWSRFNRSTYNEASSSFQNDTFESKWSVSVITALVEGCGSGMKGLVTDATAQRDGFTIRLKGQGMFDLTRVEAVPVDPKFKCGGRELATAQLPIKLNNTENISCEKDPNKSILINISTSQGSVGPFRMQSFAETVAGQRDAFADEVRALKGQLTKVQNDYQELSSKVNALVLSDITEGQLSSSTFWTAANPTHPEVNCPAGTVLSGLGWDAWSDGTIRGVGTVKYKCRGFK